MNRLPIDPATCLACIGHRPTSNLWRLPEGRKLCTRLKIDLFIALDEAYAEGYRQFLFGAALGSTALDSIALSSAALGCDPLFTEVLLAMKPAYPGIALFAAVPCGEPGERWRAAHPDAHRRLLSLCDFVFTLPPESAANGAVLCDQFLVDNATRIIAAWNGQPYGRTYEAMAYAQSLGKTVHCIRTDRLVREPA